MQASVATFPTAHESDKIPWYCHALVLSATSIIVGLLWDISWHTTIGRDTFWTPAHMAIYLGGVLAGLSCGFLVLKTTFAGTPEERATSVKIWGFRGPLGAWFAIWGAFAMITSAPFDDWWHNAYGLDVKILSPPHTILALGMMGVVQGAVMLVLARQNRTEQGGRWLRAMFVYSAGILLGMLAILLSEYCWPNLQHGGFFYIVGCGAFPLVLTAFGRASHLRWPMTAVAACYMGVTLTIAWVLQLFPAIPRLAPIYNPVDHMIPMGFPLLLVIPAFAMDVTWKRLRDRNDWVVAAALAAVFLIVFLAAQWFFSELLLSAAADNPVFMGARTWSYADRPGSWMHEYWNRDSDRFTPLTAGIAFVLAYLSARYGLARGKWLREVMR